MKDTGPCVAPEGVCQPPGGGAWKGRVCGAWAALPRFSWPSVAPGYRCAPGAHPSSEPPAAVGLARGPLEEVQIQWVYSFLHPKQCFLGFWTAVPLKVIDHRCLQLSYQLCLCPSVSWPQSSTVI